METLPRRVFSLCEEVFERYWPRVFLRVGLSSFVTFSLMGLTILFTYMRVSYDYEAKMLATSVEFTRDTREYGVKLAELRGEVRGYRAVIASLSKSGKRVPLGRFRVTAYDPHESCRPSNDGYASTGLRVVDDKGNVLQGVVAVDPGKIPYGSTIYLKQLNLLAYAADTGVAMLSGDGKNVDILVPTVKDARRFGVRYVDVELVDVSID